MNYLVIGSNGFIGRNLINHLRADRSALVWEADINCENNSKMFFEINSENADYNKIFETERFDICINCSGAASVQDSINNPLKDFQLNTVNVYKILESIRLYQPSCKFINLSSAAVYGNPVKLPIHENSELNPLSPYGMHKKQSEEICKLFHRYFQISTCSLRVFSAYGEGLTKQLFWDLYKKAISEDQVKLFGSGFESRDFIYIKDLVQAIQLVSNRASFVGEVINIANGEEVLIADCVKLFFSNFNNPVNYKFAGETRNGDPNNWEADVTALKSFGYERKFSLKEGLKNYYRWIVDLEKE